MHRAPPACFPVAQSGPDQSGHACPPGAEPGGRRRARGNRQPALELVLDVETRVRARRVRHVLARGGKALLQQADLVLKFEAPWALSAIVSHADLSAWPSSVDS